MKEQEIWETAIQSVIKYIEYHGGIVVIMGGIRIRQGHRDKNFVFEVDFTGNFPLTK